MPICSHNIKFYVGFKDYFDPKISFPTETAMAALGHYCVIALIHTQESFLSNKIGGTP